MCCISTENIGYTQDQPRFSTSADPVFDLSARQLDAHWRRIQSRAGVRGLTFHDARHWAITRLARRLGVLDLARMVGHRNINQLMTYYNASAADLARRLGGS